MKKVSMDAENYLVPENCVNQPLDEEPRPKFWGSKGSGILPISATTGRILLMLRSSLVNEPNTWGIPGGKIDDGEELIFSAIRELQEETGYLGYVDLIKSYVFREGTFEYHNFLGIVPCEFEPKLNWESTDAKWFSLDQLPENLHFGIKLLLENSGNQIVDTIKQSSSF